MRSRYWRVYAVGTLAVVIAGATSCVALGVHAHRLAQERAARRAAVAAGIPVVVARVSRPAELEHLTLPAEVKPFRRAQIFARAPGILRTLQVVIGQAVRAGEVIGTVAAPDVDEQLRTARADLAVKAQRLDRSRLLGDAGLTPREELEQAEAAVAIASAEVARREALLSYQVLRAPFDGIIVGRFMDVGALVVPPSTPEGTTPIIEIWDTSRIRIQAHVGEKDAPFIHEGDAIDIWSEKRPAEVLPGRVARTTQVLAGPSRTMMVEAEFDGSDRRFLVGGVAKIRFQLGTPGTLSIPVDAVTLLGGEPTVAVVKARRASFRPIVLGHTDGRSTRVVSGLEEGELVALFPGEDIVDGGVVSPVFANGQDAEPDVGMSGTSSAHH